MDAFQSMVTCSWQKDGDSRHRNEQPIGSTPVHCGCHGQGLYGETKDPWELRETDIFGRRRRRLLPPRCSQADGADWCDVEPHTDWCSFRPSATDEMLEQFKAEGGGDSTSASKEYRGYNEVLLDAEQWAAALPNSVSAFALPRECEQGSECYSAFTGWYADWIEKFGPWPIVHFDAEKKDAPYSAMPQPRTEFLSGLCGEEKCIPSTRSVVDSIESLEDLPLDTPDECCKACTVTDGCEGFVHWFGGAMCYLKTSKATNATIAI